MYTLNKIVCKGVLREDKKTYAFLLDIQKAYDLCGVIVCGINSGKWYKGEDTTSIMSPVLWECSQIYI